MKPRGLSTVVVAVLLLFGAVTEVSPSPPSGWSTETRLAGPQEQGEEWALPEDGRGAVIARCYRGYCRLARSPRIAPFTPKPHPAGAATVTRSPPRLRPKRPLPRYATSDPPFH